VTDPDILNSVVPAWQYLDRVKSREGQGTKMDDILHCPMKVAFRHGSYGGRVRLRDSGIDVWRSLAERPRCRSHSLAARGGQQAVECRRPEGRMEMDHFYCASERREI
jgi:hypothetical protein